MNIESELKPCPFCGGEAEIIDDAMGTVSRCRRCGAENGNGVYGEGGHKLAAKDWNSRPIEDAQAAEIKRLREALEEIQDAITLLNTADVLEHISDKINQTLKGDEE